MMSAAQYFQRRIELRKAQKQRLNSAGIKKEQLSSGCLLYQFPVRQLKASQTQMCDAHRSWPPPEQEEEFELSS
jgi:hypothetical protein